MTNLEQIQAQNQSIIQSLQLQSQALSKLLQNYGESSNEKADLRLINFESYDETKESFKSYKERLENYLQIKNLQGDSLQTKQMKAKILINSLGAKYYQLLSSLTAPDLPSNKTYDELIKLLDRHLCPLANVHTERHKFLSRIQKPDESKLQYIAALKHLSTTSNWNCEEPDCSKPVSIILQAQFIRGLLDIEIREQILQQGNDINLEKAIEIALAIEAAVKQNKIYLQSSEPSQFSDDQKEVINLFETQLRYVQGYEKDQPIKKIVV
ncbi:hypothetical protein ACJJTC_000721 [Scirpophaga incertulas]